ncbi:MAG: hypothetical protein ACE37J_00830 [Pikeienuella sp.]|uniref:hypothetical protein n=1 Tax=Pikeienuella sp. TaxID=2831957 RepID=UPI00391CD9C3
MGSGLFAPLVLLAACAPPSGPGGTDYARLSRPLTPGYVQIVSAAPRLVEVDAGGRVIRARAPDGLCIPLEGVQTMRDSAFVLFSACPGAPEAPGVPSLSISGAPTPMDLAALERFLATEAGAVGLGYGGGAEDVTLLSLKREGEALIAMAEDRSEFGPAFAGDLIIRAFVEINGRLVIATMLSRREGAAEPEEMRAALLGLVAALAEASA